MLVLIHGKEVTTSLRNAEKPISCVAKRLGIINTQPFYYTIKNLFRQSVFLLNFVKWRGTVTS